MLNKFVSLLEFTNCVYVKKDVNEKMCLYVFPL